MKKIRLTRDRHVMVDDSDWGECSMFKWYAMFNKYTGTYYATRTEYGEKGGRLTKEQVMMARWLLGVKKGSKIQVRFINGNSLDCRRENLRKV